MLKVYTAETLYLEKAEYGVSRLLCGSMVLKLDSVQVVVLPTMARSLACYPYNCTPETATHHVTIYHQSYHQGYTQGIWES